MDYEALDPIIAKVAKLEVRVKELEDMVKARNTVVIDRNQQVTDLEARVAELEAENIKLRSHTCEVGMENPIAMLDYLNSLPSSEFDEINELLKKKT